jgi:hypothetical protein
LDDFLATGFFFVAVVITHVRKSKLINIQEGISHDMGTMQLEGKAEGAGAFLRSIA